MNHKMIGIEMLSSHIFKVLIPDAQVTLLHLSGELAVQQDGEGVVLVGGSGCDVHEEFLQFQETRRHHLPHYLHLLGLGNGNHGNVLVATPDPLQVKFK